jgi:hypothetical protein
MDCLADSQDTDYQISQSASLDSGQVVAAVGTLSTQTGNATYTSLSINEFPQLIGVTNISDPALKGTAASYASALQHDSRMFYVYYVARDCKALTNCTAVTTEQVPVGGMIKLFQRNYVNPGSNRGPDPYRVLDPYMIVFDGTHRPAP